MHMCIIDVYICTYMFAGVSSKTEYVVLSIEVWKSLFDVSFLRRWTVPCVSVYKYPSTLRTVTGELLVVWAHGQLPRRLGSTDRASAHRSKCVLCREVLCAGKQAIGLCFCLSSWWRSTGIPFCQDLDGGKSLSEAASALQTSRISTAAEPGLLGWTGKHGGEDRSSAYSWQTKRNMKNWCSSWKVWLGVIWERLSKL